MVIHIKPIGIVLQQAKLITPGQLEVALYEQKQFEMLLGEILSHHGWICQETADFFVEYWPFLVKHPTHEPIGHYLKLAHLLNDEQIERILKEQQRRRNLFGSIAVLNGWLKEETINFFVNSIANPRGISPPLPDIVIPVPQLNVVRQQPSPFVEAQERETYQQSLPNSLDADLDKVPENHRPARVMSDSFNQAAETLILSDHPFGDRHTAGNKRQGDPDQEKDH